MWAPSRTGVLGSRNIHYGRGVSKSHADDLAKFDKGGDGDAKVC